MKKNSPGTLSPTVLQDEMASHTALRRLCAGSLVNQANNEAASVENELKHGGGHSEAR